MIGILYTPSFVRQYKKLDPNLKQETKKKIELFRFSKNHKALKVHKLKGKLKDKWSFSINYSHRIVFDWQNKKQEAIFYAIGDHDIYKA